MLVDSAGRCDKFFAIIGAGTMGANVLCFCIAAKSVNKIESQVFEQRP